MAVTVLAAVPATVVAGSALANHQITSITASPEYTVGTVTGWYDVVITIRGVATEECDFWGWGVDLDGRFIGAPFGNPATVGWFLPGGTTFTLLVHAICRVGSHSVRSKQSFTFTVPPSRPPEEEKDTCLVAEAKCKEEVDEQVAFYVNTICREGGKESGAVSDMRESAFASLGCLAFAELVLRRDGYRKCPQVPCRAARAAGTTCNPKTGPCERGNCRRGGLSAGATGIDGEAGRAPAASVIAEAASAAIAAIRARLRAARPRLRADVARLVRVLGQTPVRAARPELAAALLRYRRDVRKLRAAVAAVKAADQTETRARGLVLAVLDDTAAGLSSFAAGAASGRASVAAAREGRKARAAFVRAGRKAAEARRALGCGETC